MRAGPELIALPTRVITSYPATMAVSTAPPLAPTSSPTARAAGTATGPPWITHESVVSVKLWLKAAVPLASAAMGAGSLSPRTSSVASGAPPARFATDAAAVAAGSVAAAKAMPSVSITQSVAWARAAADTDPRSSSETNRGEPLGGRHAQGGVAESPKRWSRAASRALTPLARASAP